MPWGPLVGVALTVLLASRGWSIAGAPGDPVTATRNGTVIEMSRRRAPARGGGVDRRCVAGALRRGRHRGGRPGPVGGDRRRLDSGHPTAQPGGRDAAARPHHAELGSLVPQVAVLRGDPSRRLLRLRRLSAHVPPQHLRRSRRGVLGARERRDPVGRERRAHRRDHRARRERVHEPAHLPRPHEVRREAGQVHAGDRRGRRHRERPGAAARRGEPLVARARRLRRRPVRDGGRGQLRARRAGRPPRGLPGAGAGPEGQGDDARPVRRLDPGHEVLLVRRGRPGRHPGRDQPHRLDRGGGLRDLPARPEPRRRPVGAHPGRRQAVQHPRHALLGHPAHRGRHLRLGLRHRPHRQSRSR